MNVTEMGGERGIKGRINEREKRKRKGTARRVGRWDQRWREEVTVKMTKR